MSNIKINDFPTRKQYTYAGGDPVFVLDFPFFENTDIFVYVSNPAENGTQEDPENLVIQGTDYTVSGAGLAYGGEVEFSPAYNLTVGYTVTVVARMPIDRFSILETTSAITRAQYNEDLNRLTCMIQQINTIIEQTMPKYDRSEFINTDRTLPNTPFSYVNLPWLPAGYCWTGNADETGLSIFRLSAGGGVGFVTADHIGMNPSIALWTGTDFILTDSAINITDTTFVPLTAGDSILIDDTAASLGWPRHGTAARPAVPANGMVYYDTDLGGYYAYFGGNWQRFAFGDTGSIVTETVIQANDFVPKDIIRRDKDTSLYVKAQANNKENAAVCGIVTSADANQFTMQFIGKVTIAGAGWVDGRWYFLSPTDEGELTLNEPQTNGQISLPLLVATSSTTGIFFNMRGYVVSDGSDIDQAIELITETVNQPAHGFLYNGMVLKPKTTDANQYEKAIADSSPETFGTVMIREIIDVDNFIVQQVGRIETLGTVPPVPGGVVNPAFPLDLGVPYYLSDTNAGEIDTAEPANPNFSKPMLMPYQTSGGWIYPMKPSVNSGGGGGTGPTIIDTFTFSGEDEHTFSNVFDGTWDNIEIVGTGLRFAANTYLRFRVEVGGVVDTGLNYVQSDSFSTATVPAFDYLILGRPYPAQPITSETYVPSSDKSKFQFRIKCDGIFEDKVPKLFRTTSFGGYITLSANIDYLTFDLDQGYKPLNNIFPPITGIQIYSQSLVPIAIEAGTVTIYGTKMTP